MTTTEPASKSRWSGSTTLQARYTGFAVGSKSVTRVRRPTEDSATSHSQLKTPTAQPASVSPSRAACRPTSQATATTTTGSTTTNWRPGHHQPCMVSATQVATAYPAAKAPASAAQPGGRRRARAARAGTASKNAGVQAASPNPRSTSRPASLRLRPR